MLKVVTNHRGYAARRSFIDLPFEETVVLRRVDPFRLADASVHKATGRTPLVLHNLWWDVGQHDLVHLRNGISVGRSPWISSFEDYLPRWEIGVKRWIEPGLERMASDRCRALIAQCEAARARQMRVVDQYAPHLRDAIDAKLHVLLPPQAALVDAYEDKPLPQDGRVHLAFVGHDFFRKGGRELLHVLDGYFRRGAPLHLTIVSKLEHGDYATRATEADRDEARRIIRQHPAHITHHERLGHSDVLDLYRRSHVGLLLTWSDTFGYSALEAQAAGCPVITTDVNAMPEINDDAVGWMIPVPHHSWKAHAAISTPEGRQRVGEAIRSGLTAVLDAMLSDPDSIGVKGQRALAQVRERHDPARAARWMEALYRTALDPS